MKRSIPMRRSSFKPSRLPFDPVDSEARAEARQQRLAGLLVGVVRKCLPAQILPGVLAVPKEPKPARSEAYRRAVASLSCAHCGVTGYSQHAHENEGKAKGVKLDDRRAMPLCCARPGIEGCHAAYDQYRLLPGGREAHIEAGKLWAAQTRAQINKLGLWPKRLPQLE